MVSSDAGRDARKATSANALVGTIVYAATDPLLKQRFGLEQRQMNRINRTFRK